MMSSDQQALNFYMPCIYWHDRDSLLSIDICRQQQQRKQSSGGNGSIEYPVYKIATASMQKEIRVWNFWFEKAAPAQQQATKRREAPPPKMAKTDEATNLKSEPVLVVSQGGDEEDNIICLECPEKENNTTGREEPAKKDEDVEMEEANENPKVIEEKMEEGQNSEKRVEGRPKVVEEKMEEKVEEPKTDQTEKMEIKSNAEQKGPELRTKVQASHQQPLSVDFLCNIEGHRFTTNVVRFSPNGTYIASGDADGHLLVWKLEEEQPPESMENMRDSNKNGGGSDPSNGATNKGQRKVGDPEMDIPPNKENWIRAFRLPFRHEADVTGVCWSPDSQMVASVSMDDSVAVHRVDIGKRLWMIRGFRHFTNGIAWDPRGKYLVTMSTDRRMDVLDAQKGTRLRCCHQIELPLTPLPQSDGVQIIQQSYKVFHDDQLCSFQRGLDFSPCGGVVLAPAVHLEVGANNIYGIFAFLRADLAHCRPTALFPTVKPTIQAKCSPVVYELFDGPNFLGLPHRLIFAVLTRDSVLIYSSQNESPLAYIENIQYDKLTSLVWTPDGKILVISSMEGFNSFIIVDPKKLGTPCEIQPDFLNNHAQQPQPELIMELQGQQLKTPTKPEMAPTTSGATPAAPTPPHHPLLVSLPDSPKLITPRRPRAKKVVMTPAGADGTTPKAEHPAGQQEKRTLPDDSPKTIVPRKKPKKVQTIQLPTGGEGTSSGGTK